MRRIGTSSALRAILLAWGLFLIFSPTHLMAAPLDSPESIDRADRSDEPFGLSTATVTKGAVLEKWLNVEREVDDERQVLIPILHQSELMMYGKDVMERTSPGLRSM